MTNREKRALRKQGHTRDEVEQMNRAQGEAKKQALLDMIEAHRERMAQRPRRRMNSATASLIGLAVALGSGVPDMPRGRR